MTAQKHLKQLVRARMQKTGESYSTARRQLLDKVKAGPDVPWHFPGNVPATTALRVLLSHTGVRDPNTGQPFSEAMLFGLAGGVGIGVFAFYYEQANFASLFVGGRHLWHDDLAYLRTACERFRFKPVVHESSGVKPAEKALRQMVADHGPCVAWVDAAHLPHRALPTQWSGSGYHVVTVYRIDGDAALIGDLTDEPASLTLAQLAEARGRIKKFKNRLLALPAGSTPQPDVPALVQDGLQRCHDGLNGAGAPANARGNFSLASLRTLAERMHGAKEKDRERWERVFPPGPRLWQGLKMLHDFIENYGTGGGLCRPLFAEFLAEVERPDLARRYAELGRQWSALADAALPDDVPLFRKTKQVLARKAELTNSGAPPDELQACWQQLGELAQQARDAFPLSEAECAALRLRLKEHVLALYEDETQAHAALV
jgi:hypothetical protein